MYLLLAASVEGTQTSQTHSEIVNAREVELKVMYILERAEFYKPDLTYLTSVCFY